MIAESIIASRLAHHYSQIGVVDPRIFIKENNKHVGGVVVGRFGYCARVDSRLNDVMNIGVFQSGRNAADEEALNEESTALAAAAAILAQHTHVFAVDQVGEKLT